MSSVLFKLIIIVILFTTTAMSWDVQLSTSHIHELQMGKSVEIHFNSTTYENDSEESKIEIISTDSEVIITYPRFFDLPKKDHQSTWNAKFNITGQFLGYAKIYLQMVQFKNGNVVSITNSSNSHISVTVVREQRFIDKVFLICVVVLMSIIFINLGCAIEAKQIKECLQKPIAPISSFVSQFIILPIISYYYAKLIFPNQVAMQLGLYFTGISPGGGASSVWSVLLGGNINLSVVLTTIGTLESYIMIPFWATFLGSYIFAVEELPVPYSRIGSSILSLIIPLIVGVLIQRFMPRVCKVMVRVLKPLSSFLILFIIIFATVSNLYLFKIFSWQILLAGALIPWTGYIIGFITAYIAQLPVPDIISMTIESGIQNTGIAIFMLKFSLGQPAADITTVVPVAVALMTPIPLTVAFIFKKCLQKKKQEEIIDVATVTMLNENKE
ncbi:P3 protein-like [Daktulosphaira vitifoliae]|uniref:P3 protein-like n=1 Tax=Daktulosphaira vitifoliae TaxID=58002 RepID=UPI0021A99FC1|nr:P3 protein-like [Daktulosphaira vitifoliae]